MQDYVDKPDRFNSKSVILSLVVTFTYQERNPLADLCFQVVYHSMHILQKEKSWLQVLGSL